MPLLPKCLAACMLWGRLCSCSAPAVSAAVAAEAASAAAAACAAAAGRACAWARVAHGHVGLSAAAWAAHGDQLGETDTVPSRSSAARAAPPHQQPHQAQQQPGHRTCSVIHSAPARLPQETTDVMLNSGVGAPGGTGGSCRELPLPEG
eukprot:364195-Chlamydomonas_euryale.AAC.12